MTSQKNRKIQEEKSMLLKFYMMIVEQDNRKIN